jgi:hypothetical protein
MFYLCCNNVLIFMAHTLPGLIEKANKLGYTLNYNTVKSSLNNKGFYSHYLDVLVDDAQGNKQPHKLNFNISTFNFLENENTPS